MAKKKNKKNNSKKKVLNEYNQINKQKTINKTINNIRQDNVNDELKNAKKDNDEVIIPNNIHEKIQTYISILFTIIIFLLLLFLIMVIYNNYLKPTKEINKEEVCQEYIKKDYNIQKEDIVDYIKENRGILYNLDKFDIDNLTNKDLIEIAKYIIWSTSEDYQLCDDEENCLVTKKEMDYDILIEQLETFLQKDNLDLDLSNIEQDKDIYLYQRDNMVVLTFNEFEYETLKHEIVDILIDEDNITVYFALSKKIPNSDYYDYVGSKKMLLKYDNDKLILQKII